MVSCGCCSITDCLLNRYQSHLLPSCYFEDCLDNQRYCLSGYRELLDGVITHSLFNLLQLFFNLSNLSYVRLGVIVLHCIGMNRWICGSVIGKGF